MESMPGFFAEVFTVRDGQPDMVLFRSRAHYTVTDAAAEPVAWLKEQEGQPQPDAIAV
jgi:hypothetical protein